MRALRKFKFDAGEVNTILRQHILKKTNTILDYDIKVQVIKNELYILRQNCELIDSSKIMREILNLISKDLNLKIMTIEWFTDN